MANVKKGPDHLVEVLKQIQARKTVKPEDATKALQQYTKVQEHIKELKAEIEVFKAVSEKEKQANQKQTNGRNIPRRLSLNIKQKPNGPKQPSPSVRPTSDVQTTPRQRNGPVETKTSSAKLPSIVTDHKEVDKSKATIQKGPVKESQKENTKKAGVDSTKERNSDDNKQLPNKTQGNGSSEKKSTADPPTDNGSTPNSAKKGQLVQLKTFPTPQKLAEDFKRIYDMEWRSAYHDLEKHYKLTEDTITELLAGIAKEAYVFCLACERQQFEDIKKGHSLVTDVLVQPRYTTQNKDMATAKSKAIIDKNGFQTTRKFLKDYRRAMARVPIPGLIEIFEQLVQKDVVNKLTPLRITPKSTRPYIQRLIEMNWLMALQDPPMLQVWPRGGQLMNRDWFTSYSKKGATILHTVWPALFLQKDGPIAEKGICFVK